MAKVSWGVQEFVTVCEMKIQRVAKRASGKLRMGSRNSSPRTVQHLSLSIAFGIVFGKHRHFFTSCIATVSSPFRHLSALVCEKENHHDVSLSTTKGRT